MSPIPLYLIGGLCFGTGGVVPLGSIGDFTALAGEVGVVLLLLLLGLEYSAAELTTGLRRAWPAGVLDIVLNAAPGVAVALALGWGPALRDVAVRRSRIGALLGPGIDLSRVSFESSRLDFVNLRGATLSAVQFVDCRIGELDLGMVQATQVRFRDCQVERLDVTGATLDAFDMRGAPLARLEGLDRGGEVAARVGRAVLRDVAGDHLGHALPAAFERALRRVGEALGGVVLVAGHAAEEVVEGDARLLDGDGAEGAAWRNQDRH